MEESEEPKQKNRSRKKQLYGSIRSQMEFYFSPSSLAKDNMTSRLLNEKGSIELTVFLGYNRIRSLTNNVNDLAKALKHSEELEVTEDMKVKPKALQTKDNVDDCTIYIEHIPVDAEHDWLKEQFSVYGPVDYVSIPKYSTSKKCKGFAFVEFASPEYAEKAVEAYKKAGSYLASGEMDPKELLSISTYENKFEEKTDKIGFKENVQIDPKISKTKKKRKADDGENSETVEEKKARKNSDAPEEEQEIPESKVPEETTEENNTRTEENNARTEEAIQEENIESENVEDTKKKRNRNKKKKVKKTKVTAESSGFQILSKKDWKQLRNKYLTMQREKTKLLKQHLGHIKKKQYDHKVSKNEEVEESVTSTIPMEFVPGIIVKLSLNEPVVNVKQFKHQVKSVNSEVKYVDLKEGATEIYVRLKEEQDSKKFCEDSPWQDAEILTGEEEVEYWKRIQKDREDKLSKPKVKQRGRDKLFKKAEKVLGQHIIFDDV